MVVNERSAASAAPGPPDQDAHPTVGGRSRGLLRSVGQIHELGILLALLILIAVIGLARPNFLAAASLVNVGRQTAFFGIMALGMVFLLSMREIDLSVGVTYAVSIMGAAVLMRAGVNPWLAAAAGLLIGMALGGLNGLIANVLKIPTIIVTLGTLSAYRGVSLIVSDGRTVSGLPRDHAFFRVLGGSVLGVPASVWALLILTVVLSVLFRATRFGFTVRAIGSNEQAAALSGIAIRRVRLRALVLMGGLAAVSGMLTLGFFAGADPNLGQGYELLVIAAAIIGGTPLSGGAGTVLGALLGALMISVIRTGLVQFGVTANWSILVTGLVIIAAVALDALVRRRRAARVAMGTAEVGDGRP